MGEKKERKKVTIGEERGRMGRNGRDGREERVKERDNWGGERKNVEER